MKKNWSIKKYVLFCMLISITVQQLQSSDFDVNTTYIIGTTAIVGALAYATYLHLNQPSPTTIPYATTSHIKSIVFDLDGVLSATNKLRAFREIGIPVTLWEIADQMQLPSEKILFHALDGVPAVSTYTSYNKGLRMPQIMIDWQVGAQSLPMIRKSITDYLATANQAESLKNWVLQSAMMMTDPTKFIATRQTIPANIKLLHELKEKGYTLYVLSNWDPTSFPLFKAAFPEIFMYKGKEIFDGIMISGNVGIVKPEAAVFKKCLHDFQLTAQQTLFIDDEPANIAQAQKLDIKTVLCNPYDAHALHDHVLEQLQG